MKKVSLFFIIFFVCHSISAQVVFLKAPQDKQLYGRNVLTNKALIEVEGTVNNTSVNYDELKIEILREGVFYHSETKLLTYDASGEATFTFTFTIDAELANYTLNVYGLESSAQTLEYTANDFVGGDVYIIQGQSNAVAQMYSGSSNVNQNNFIRVFERSNVDIVRNEWFIAQGDGDGGINGNAGQWGLKLAKLLVDTYQIPVAIFNGAKGGRPISFFQAPGDYQTSTSSNYGKLYYRLNYTNLKDKVRAVFWSQGENTGDLSNLSDYKSKFLALKSSWLIDYPNIEGFYIFQTKIGCGVPSSRFKLSQEPQRVLAVENTDIHVMSTLSLTQSGGCHFQYNSGYEEFANRIFELVKRDLFNEVPPVDIEAPMPTNVYMSATNEITIETNSSALSMSLAPTEFSLQDAGSTVINSISVIDSKIILSLSSNPGSVPKVSYSGPLEGTTGNFITNTRGIELLSFYDYPVDTSVLSIGSPSLKNDFFLQNQESKIKISAKKHFNEVKIYDLVGRIIYSKSITNTQELSINKNSISKNFLILHVKFQDGNYSVKKCFIP